MYRIVKMSGVIYACEILDIEDDTENIEEFTGQGQPVILCENIDDLDDFGIDVSEIVYA